MTKDSSWESKERSLYLSMHFDRLNEELITGFYQKTPFEKIKQKKPDTS